MPHKEIMTVTMDDGTPDGTLKVDLAAWDCAMYRIERIKLQNYTNDPNLMSSGIYFLVGKENGNPSIYVGQANIRNNGKGVLYRVRQHDTSIEDYWNIAFLFYSHSNTLFATELNYLERKLWEKISRSSHVVKNISTPALGNYSAVTQFTMDKFMAGMDMMIESFQYDFLKPSTPNTSRLTVTRQFFIKRTSNIPGRSVNAICEIRNSQFVVLRGSKIATAPRNANNSRKYKHDVYANLIDTSGKTIQDISFGSVSGASEFVVYGTSNGKIDWKDGNGQPIKNFIP